MSSQELKCERASAAFVALFQPELSFIRLDTAKAEVAEALREERWYRQRVHAATSPEQLAARKRGYNNACKRLNAAREELWRLEDNIAQTPAFRRAETTKPRLGQHVVGLRVDLRGPWSSCCPPVEGVER